MQYSPQLKSCVFFTDISQKYNNDNRMFCMNFVRLDSSIKCIYFDGNKYDNKYLFLCSRSSLVKVLIPSSVTSIGPYAFRIFTSLTQITIPSSVTSIGDYAFNECSSLTQITFTIPSSVTSIGDYAFYGCSSLTQITIPSSVTSIGSYAFYGCNKLAQVTIPSSINRSSLSIPSSANIKTFE